MKTNNPKIYLPLLIIAVIFSVGFFVFVPAAKNIKKTAEEISAQRKTIEQIYASKQFLEPTKKKLEEIKTGLKKYEHPFIVLNQELDLITTLENLANENNINQKIDLIEPAVPLKSKKTSNASSTLEEMTLSIKLTGDYQKILKYLISLESLNYYIIINNIKFVNYQGGDLTIVPNQETGANNVDGFISAKIFRKKI